jgi:hypothetical protein
MVKGENQSVDFSNYLFTAGNSGGTTENYKLKYSPGAAGAFLCGGK